MPLNFGSTRIEKIIKDGTEIKDLYYGSTQVYKKRTFTSNFTYRKRWGGNSEPTTPTLYIYLLRNGTVIKTITVASSNYTAGASWDEQVQPVAVHNKIMTASIPITFDFYDGDTYTVKYYFYNFTTHSVDGKQYVIFNDGNSTYRKEFTMTGATGYYFTLGALTDDTTVTFYTDNSATSKGRLTLFANTSPVNIPISQSTS